MSIKRIALATLASAVLVGLPAAASAQAGRQHPSTTHDSTMPMDHNMSMDHMNMGAMKHPASHTITVYKEKDCNCCGKWAEHLRKAGFPVKVVQVADVTPTNVKLGVPEKLRTCHTATVAGYVVVGHVPADVIHKLLAEKPKNIIGISAPGMPMGSPGMEEDGSKKDHYDILTFDKQGKTTVYAHR
jgi:hypothetical protein